jgi:hypothetical protein
MSGRHETANTLTLVRKVIGQLSDCNCRIILGGGWAKQLLGLIPACPHKDVDLYYLGTDLSPIDSFITDNGYEEIQPKHMVHKRAFLVGGVMIEVVLIQKDSQGYYSPFSPWGGAQIRWPEPLSTTIAELGISCLGRESLEFYTY